MHNFPASNEHIIDRVSMTGVDLARRLITLVCEICGRKFGAYGLPDAKAESRYMIRQNQLLFKSLQTHTQGKVDCGVLEQWEKSWNRCVSALTEFEEAGRGILQNIFEQKPYLKATILKQTDRKDVMERILKGVLHIVWQQILNSNEGEFSPVMNTVLRSDGQTEALFGKDNLSEGIIFREATTEMVDEIKRAAIGLSNGYSAVELTTEIKKMQSIIDGLTESLNPLSLRPLILHTRCDLCPA